MDKKVLLTYDYELFLGSDSGDMYKSLIDPTNKILGMLNRYDAKGLFFIDTSFLVAIKDTECFNPIKKQIQDIVVQGHDIGLHIHAHWQDVLQSDKCRWKFEDFKHFRLHSFSDIEIETIIQNSYNLLSSIVLEVNDKYKIDTFRAGGFCLQPFNKLKKIFKKIGIKYDFSVLPDMKDEDLPKHYYDYTDVPKDKYIWKFSDDVMLEDNKGEFIEISNTVFNMNIIDLIKNKKKIKHYKITGDGRGAGSKKTFLEQLRRVKWNIKQIVSSDSIDIDIFKKYMKRIDREVLVYVAHPKLFSENSYSVLEYLCENFNVIGYKEVKV